MTINCLKALKSKYILLLQIELKLVFIAKRTYDENRASVKNDSSVILISLNKVFYHLTFD